MDIRTKVEARKAELAAGDLAGKKAAEAAEQARVQAERARREAALDKIAQEISHDGIEVERKGEEIELVPELEPLDVTGLRKDKLRKLLDREARKLWSPGENWMAITLIVAGLCLIPISIFSLVLSVAGLAHRQNLNKKYRAVVTSKYPGVFAPLTAAEM